jgi:hypothetical protein
MLAVLGTDPPLQTLPHPIDELVHFVVAVVDHSRISEETHHHRKMQNGHTKLPILH